MSKALVTLLDGLPLKNPKAQIKITFNQEFLVIEETKPALFGMSTVNTFRIPLCNLLDSIVTTEKELIAKDKSVIGRGVVGGLLFGPAGLILGGLSGIGSKQSTKTNHVYIVSYLSSEGEIKNITFTMPFLMVSVTEKFNKDLKKKLATIIRSQAVLNILNKPEVSDFVL